MAPLSLSVCSHALDTLIYSWPWICSWLNCCWVAHLCPISQARILELVAISFSRGSSWPRDQTPASCIGRWILSHWATREAQLVECMDAKLADAEGRLYSMYYGILYKGLEFSRFCCWQVVLEQILHGYGRQLYLLWAVSILRSIILTHLWDFNSWDRTWHIVSH